MAVALIIATAAGSLKPALPPTQSAGGAEVAKAADGAAAPDDGEAAYEATKGGGGVFTSHLALAAFVVAFACFGNGDVVPVCPMATLSHPSAIARQPGTIGAIAVTIAPVEDGAMVLLLFAQAPPQVPRDGRLGTYPAATTSVRRSLCGRHPARPRNP